MLKHWIEHFWDDFEADCPALSDLALEWLDQLAAEGVLTASSLKSKLVLALDPIRALNMSSRPLLNVAANYPRPYHPESLAIPIFGNPSFILFSPSSMSPRRGCKADLPRRVEILEGNPTFRVFKPCMDQEGQAHTS